MAAGSTDVIIADSSFGTASGSLGLGQGAYGVQIDGGERFHISNTTAKGLTAEWNVTGLTDSSADCLSFSWVPVYSSSGGGSFGATPTATATYQRVGSTIKWTIKGNVSNVGAATGFLQFSVPYNVKSSPVVDYLGSAVSNGDQAVSIASAGTSYIRLSKTAGGSTAIAGDFQASGQFQIA